MNVAGNELVEEPFGVMRWKRSIYNELGFPGDLPTTTRDVKKFRVFITGSSSVQAGDPTISKVLELELHKAGIKEAEVFNFGTGASILRQDVLRIMFEMAAYKPDLVVHYSGANDMGINIADPRINYPHRFYLEEMNPLKNLKASSFKTIDALLLSSQFVRTKFPDYLIDRIVIPHMTKVQNSMPEINLYNKIKVAAFYENLLWGKKISEAIGSNYIFVLQPTVSFKSIRHKNEWQMPNEIVLSQKKILLESIKNSSIAFNFLDLSDLFKDDTRQVFTDEMHLVNKEDNIYPAKKITEHIVSNKIYNYRNRSSEVWSESKSFKW